MWSGSTIWTFCTGSETKRRLTAYGKKAIAVSITHTMSEAFALNRYSDLGVRHESGAQAARASQ